MLHIGIEHEFVTNATTAAYLAGTPNRVYPLVIPQKVPRGAPQTPCVVYETDGIDRQVTYCGTSGLSRTSMKIDCYAEDYNTAKQVAQAVREVLLDFRGLLGGTVEVRHAALETEFDLQDIEPGLYRISQSWTIWHEE
jgi:hypothetical protein